MSTASKRVEAIVGHLAATPLNVQTLPNLTHAKKKGPAPLKKPMKVVITGAAGNIAYSIIFMVAEGQMLGKDQPIELRLLDIPPMAKQIQGVIMELQDCAYPLITAIIGTTDYKTAFQDVDIALLIGAKPRGPGMQRKDLLSANGQIFSGQGKSLNQFASRNVKIVVVGNPANTNCLILRANAPDLPDSAFSAMTRLDQNRSQAQISGRVGVNVQAVKNIIIWGNHSKTQYPDINHATIQNYPQAGAFTPVRAAVNDNKWLDGEFITTVQDRGAAIIDARQKSSAASAASACVDHVRDWVLGTPQGQYVSMAVPSDGSYGIPKGLIFSFPVTCQNGQFTIVRGLKVDSESQKRIDLTTKELLEEKNEGLVK